MNRHIRYSLVISFFIQVASATGAQSEEAPKASLQNSASVSQQLTFEDAPTYIKADKLDIDMENHLFTYTGNVELKQGDLSIWAYSLEGTYNENNEVQNLVAKQDVLINKGEKIKAASQRAEYDSKEKVVLLTENPEVQQEGSILTADIVRIFLEEDRSVAEGTVRVKLDKAGDSNEKLY